MSAKLKILLMAFFLAVLPAVAFAEDQAGDDNAATALKYMQQSQDALGAGEPDKALNVITDALLYVNGKEKADIYATRALVYLRMGKNSDALADVSQALKIATDRPLAYEVRGMAWYDSNEPGLAIPDFDRAIELGSGSSDVFLLRGNLYMQRNNPKAALRMFSRAVELDPESIEALFQRAYAYSSMGWFDLALSDYEKIAKLAPSNAFAYNDMGIMNSSLGRHDEAIKNFKAAVSLDPAYASAYSNLGYTLFEKGDTEGAMQQYSRAEELEKTNAYAICNGAEVYINQGNSVKARGALKRCFKAADSDPDFTAFEAYYFDALKRIKGILDAGDSLPSYDELLKKAETALDGNDRRQAYDNYNAAYILKPGSEEPLFGMGKCAVLLGRYFRAASFLSEYIGLFPGGAHADEAKRLLDKSRVEPN
jgi:tetratricopeptide (TPR) repeat protein